MVNIMYGSSACSRLHILYRAVVESTIYSICTQQNSAYIIHRDIVTYSRIHNYCNSIVAQKYLRFPLPPVRGSLSACRNSLYLMYLILYSRYRVIICDNTYDHYICLAYQSVPYLKDNNEYRTEQICN